MNKCVDVIVTYNRRELLKENIAALRSQTFKEHDIMIIDNCSTDGTKDMVLQIDDPRIIYINTGANLGGAGGFSFGIEKAISLGYEFAWIMDDDSIPKDDALKSLMKKAKEINKQFSFMASLVYWTDGKLFDMNLPNYVCKSKHEAQFEFIRDYKLLPIQTCSFVGCFINLSIARIVGLPISEFFIYADDIEYTLRLRKEAPAYLDLDSSIIHKAPSNQGADIVTASKDRINRFYYQSRNGMYVARKNRTILKRLRLLSGRVYRIIIKSPDNKGKRLIKLIKGTIDGLFFNPEIKFAKKNR